MLRFESHHSLYNTENHTTSKVVYSLCVTKQLLQDIIQLVLHCLVSKKRSEQLSLTLQTKSIKNLHKITRLYTLLSPLYTITQQSRILFAMKVSGVSACLTDALQADWCVYPPLIFDFITLVTVKYVGFTLKHHFH